MTKHDFQYSVFEQKVHNALRTVERVLEVNRNPCLAEDVDHEYVDKYRLVDLATNTTVIAQLNTLVYFGLTGEALKAIDQSKPTTLRFQASDSCTFLKEQTVEVPMGRAIETDEHTQTTGSIFGSTTKSTIKQVVKHIQEYHWKVDVRWEISIFAGADVAEKTVLQERSSSMVLVIQSTKHAPLPEHRGSKPLDFSLTWLLKKIDTDTMTSKLRVDTQAPETKTPRRNKTVEDTLAFMADLSRWTNGIRAYFNRCVQRDILDQHNPAGPQPTANRKYTLATLSGDSIFVPVLPLMEDPKEDIDAKTETLPKSVLSLPISDTEDQLEELAGLLSSQEVVQTVTGPSKSTILSVDDMHKLLNEQIRSIQEQVEILQKSFPGRQLNKVVSIAEASLVVVSHHSDNLSFQYRDCVDYIEKMLEQQLVAAIGKSVQASDVDQFVKYYNARLLNPPPQPFCHSIRRLEHYPDGLLSIEGPNKDGKMEPIDTLSKEIESVGSMKVPLNAATTIELTGKTFLHAWVQHRFGPNHRSYQLVARARQFSSFMLVVGTMAGPDKLDPQDAIILQNKDEVLIPLLLDELPTAQEFKDATRSLSPEQQRFAQAFRSMQLSSSVLGICVIQIKPQLEALLNLPTDGLTKEMKLTQELMELFVDYQVPSDLLSYDGGMDGDSSVREKIDNVKGNVKAVLDVITEAKTQQLKDEKAKADMALQAARNVEFGSISSARNVKSGSLPSASNVKFGSPASNVNFDSCSMPDESFIYECAPSSNQIALTMRKHKFQLEPDSCEPDSSTKSSKPSFKPKKKFSGSHSVAGDRHLEGEIYVRPDGKKVRRIRKTAISGSDPVAPAPTPSNKPEPETEETDHRTSNDEAFDVTMMPKILDAKIQLYAPDSALRSTIVKTSNEWQRKRQDNLLTGIKSSSLRSNEIASEKDKAFDLLDALSRSGSLGIECSELHVIVSVTHCFDKDIMGTIIEDNINPIEKLEMSTLLVASAVHGTPVSELIRSNSDRLRLQPSFPASLATENKE